MKKLYIFFFTTLLFHFGFSQVYLTENFNTGIPASWAIVDGGSSVDTWTGTSGGLLGQYLDGTEFAIVNSDAAGNFPGVRMVEELISPAVNTTGATQVLLEFDHRYQDVFTNDSAWVEVFDGTNWVTVRSWNANTGDWVSPTSGPAHEIIDITAQSNANLRVKYVYDDDSTWAWHWSVDNVKIWAPFNQDVAAIEAPDPPRNGCGLSATEAVTIVFFNNGADTLTLVDVAFDVNGSSVGTETVTGTFAPGDTITYTFTTTANLGAAGTYNFDVYTELGTDQDLNNDTLSFVVENFNPIATFPYFEDFENGPAGWFSDGSFNTWAFGTPAKNVIIGAASGDSAWVTGGLGLGAYSNSEASWVESPCFDFTNINNPWISLSAWWNSEFSWDGAMIQTSVDNGVTWNRVGNNGDPFNWYNDNTIQGLPGMQGWTGTLAFNGSGDWVSAKHHLNGLGGQPSVKIRIFFGSDTSVNDDGFAFDDILIYEPPPFDAFALGALAPVSGCQLTNSESVTFQIFNNGLDTLQNFPAYYSINGGTAVAGMVTGPILPGDTLTYTFTTNADLSTPGTYNFLYYTDVAGDSTLNNDTTAATVVNFLPISTFPYYEDFESGPGNWSSGGTNNSWEFGTPAKNIIVGAASGLNAWVTGGVGTGLYNNGEASFVESPCMSFATINDPWIAMDVWWNSEFSWDGAVLEASTDNGVTWIQIGNFGDPYNWYTDSSVAGVPNMEAWSGNQLNVGSGAWVTAKHDLSAVANAPAVNLRIFFGSDFSVGDDGFAFDNVTIAEPPTVSLGADTFLCVAPFVLDPGTNPGTYTWNTGDSTNTISVDTSGSYIVTYTDTLGLCAMDTIVVTFDPAIPVITGDTIFCQGDTATLTTTATFPAYNWSTGGLFGTELVTSPGQVIVTVTNLAGCSGSDTVNVVQLAAPQPNVSQTPVFCTGDTLVLSTDSTWNMYAWSTGGNQQVESITTGGLVTVLVADAAGCQGATQINVIENPLPVVNLGPDTTLCDGASITLGGSDPNATYVWSTGQTSQSINITLAGDYILVCTDQNNCTADDTVGVTAFVSPSANFAFDTTNCPIVTFTDQSIGTPTAWDWDFGDLTGTSTQQNPNYTYLGGGQFNTVLTVTNECGSNMITKLVEITCLVGMDEALQGQITIYPNPSDGLFQIGFEALQADEVTLEVTDLFGRTLLEQELDQTVGTFRQNVDLRAQPKGAYLLRLNVDGREAAWRVFVE